MDSISFSLEREEREEQQHLGHEGGYRNRRDGRRVWVTQKRSVLDPVGAKNRLVGARTLFGSLAWVPLIGLVAMLAAPLAEAAAITFAGDRVGPYRSSLFWPVVVSYVVTAIGSTASFALWAMGVGIAVPGLMLMLAPGGVVGSLAYVGAGLLVGGALILVAGTVAWALSSVVSAAAALVAYQLNKSPKHADDNGTDFPRLLPRGKGFPLPFLRGGDEEGDSSEEDPPPGSTPVGAEVQP